MPKSIDGEVPKNSRRISAKQAIEVLSVGEDALRKLTDLTYDAAAGLGLVPPIRRRGRPPMNTFLGLIAIDMKNEGRTRYQIGAFLEEAIRTGSTWVSAKQAMSIKPGLSTDKRKREFVADRYIGLGREYRKQEKHTKRLDPDEHRKIMKLLSNHPWETLRRKLEEWLEEISP